MVEGEDQEGLEDDGGVLSRRQVSRVKEVWTLLEACEEIWDPALASNHVVSKDAIVEAVRGGGHAGMYV